MDADLLRLAVRADVGIVRDGVAAQVGVDQAGEGTLILDRFNYSDRLVPVGYRCSSCGATGVKLWRQYNTFACFIELLCVDCAREDQGVDYEVDEQGFHDEDGLGPCDQIEWLVPAIPTEDGYTYWGYTSVPEAGCRWWDDLLPLRRPRWHSLAATVLMLLALALVVVG